MSNKNFETILNNFGFLSISTAGYKFKEYKDKYGNDMIVNEKVVRVWNSGGVLKINCYKEDFETLWKNLSQGNIPINVLKQ